MREPLSGETTNQSFQSRFALHTLDSASVIVSCFTALYFAPIDA